MIPLAAIPWRLVGAAGLVVAIALMGWRVSAWKSSHEALPGVRDALEREEACADGSKCADRVAALVARQEQATAEAVAGYEQELEALRNRPVRTDPVRLCVAARGGSVRVPAPAGGTDGNSAAGVLDRPDGSDYQPGPDIGPLLREYAREAEALSASKRVIVRRDAALADGLQERLPREPREQQ